MDNTGKIVLRKRLSQHDVRTQAPVHYRTARVNALEVFYREAGASHAPAVLLLHGLPTSFNMFRHLIPRLAGAFHVIAPDYPGFGQSSMPPREDFAYTFENLTTVVEHLVKQLGLGLFSLYVMDYGAPVGYRLALRHPERVQALIESNGNAYDEGLCEFWIQLSLSRFMVRAASLPRRPPRWLEDRALACSPARTRSWLSSG